MYETTDVMMRQHAEKLLVDLVNDPQALQKCQLLFQRAVVSFNFLGKSVKDHRIYHLPILSVLFQSPFSQHLAASTLLKLVTKTGSAITVQQKLDISMMFPSH